MPAGRREAHAASDIGRYSAAWSDRMARRERMARSRHPHRTAPVVAAAVKAPASSMKTPTTSVKPAAPHMAATATAAVAASMRNYGSRGDHQ